MTDIPTQLAAALRNYPCLCITVGSWPLFVAESKAHQARKCARCRALEAYELDKAQRQIVQKVGERQG